jgi:hypothetical protein
MAAATMPMMEPVEEPEEASLGLGLGLVSVGEASILKGSVVVNANGGT